MGSDPFTDSEKAAKGALFSRLVETLPSLLALRPQQGLAPVLDALEAVRTLTAGPNTAHQNLFRQGLEAVVSFSCITCIHDRQAVAWGSPHHLEAVRPQMHTAC